MSFILLYFFMAVGLSMDAFSLAILYGTNNLVKKRCIICAKIIARETVKAVRKDVLS